MEGVPPSGLWEMWESRTIVRLFQAAVGIRFQIKAAAGHPLADFHGCGIFHRLLFFFFASFFFFFESGFPSGKPAGSRYESSTLLQQRLEETFERDQHGERDVCSDVVLRGLDYKVYERFLPDGVSLRGYGVQVP